MALRKNMRLSICKTAGGHWTTLSASRSRTSLSAVKKWWNVYVKKMMKLNFPFASEMTCPAWLSVLEGNQGPQGHYVFILDLSILGTGDTSKTDAPSTWPPKNHLQPAAAKRAVVKRVAPRWSDKHRHMCRTQIRQILLWSAEPAWKCVHVNIWFRIGVVFPFVFGHLSAPPTMN